MKKTILENGIWQSKKGSSIVLILIIFSSILILIYSYILATKKIASISYTDSVLTLGGKSILSEFDVDLKRDYGLLAFNGLEYNLESKISTYINYSLRKKENLNLESIKVDTSKDSLLNIKRAEEEMIDYSKYAIIERFKEDRKSEIIGEDYTNRVLRNEGAINSLPSNGVENSSAVNKILSIVKSGKKIFKNTGDEYFLNQYIISMFNNKAYKINRRGFFENEVEYILQGKLNDDKNYTTFRGELKLLRNGINIAHIYSDPKKVLQLEAAALAISPGPQAAATQLALAEAWALAEAENDILLLENGKKVPILKTSTTWAIDLQSIMGSVSHKYIDTTSTTGLTYQGYLQLFLIFLDDDIKVARALDLIQINMQGNYNRTFLIKEYNLGFYVRVRVNGREHDYSFKY